MDNNNDDGPWMYNMEDPWMMDLSLFRPLSAEPLIEPMEDIDTETPNASSYLVDGERTFLILPFTPPTSPLPPPSPALPVNIQFVTASPQSSPPPPAAFAPGSRGPMQRTRKTIKKTEKPTPKYMLNAFEPGRTEEDQKRILHAQKCRLGRLKKAQEKESLKQKNDRLANKVAIITEQLQTERLRMEAIKAEIERRGHVILALSVLDSLSSSS